jgi:hypothetical protein
MGAVLEKLKIEGSDNYHNVRVRQCEAFFLAFKKQPEKAYQIISQDLNNLPENARNRLTDKIKRYAEEK